MLSSLPGSPGSPQGCSPFYCSCIKLNYSLSIRQKINDNIFDRHREKPKSHCLHNYLCIILLSPSSFSLFIAKMSLKVSLKTLDGEYGNLSNYILYEDKFHIYVLQVPGHPAWKRSCKPALEGRLNQMTSRGLFQPQPFCSSVTTDKIPYHSEAVQAAGDSFAMVSFSMDQLYFVTRQSQICIYTV